MSIKRWEFYCIGMNISPIDPNVEHGIGVREFQEDGLASSTPFVKYDDHVAEVERLTALLKESDDERLALKEHYPKLRSQLASARDEQDALTIELARKNAQLHQELAAARAERDGLAKALHEIARHNPVMGVPAHSDLEMAAIAEAALAALSENGGTP